MKNIRKLFFPLLAFIIFTFLLFYYESIASGIKGQDSETALLVFYYLIQTGFWLTAAHLLNVLLRLYFWDTVVSHAIGGKVPRLLIHFFSLLIYLGAIMVIVGYVFHKPLTGLWATSGVMALVLGFALRNMILDLFTGLAVNIERPYQIGDWIQINMENPKREVYGEVIDINWRATRLKNEEEKVFIISNSLLTNYIITNYTYPGRKIRFETSIHLDHSVPVSRAKRIMKSAARKVLKEQGFFTEPDPSIVITEINEFGIQYTIRYYIYPWKGVVPTNARDKINSSILEYLAFSGLKPAYPKGEYRLARLEEKFHDNDSVVQRLNLLRKTILFNSLEEQELMDLAGKIEARSYSEGDTVINKGDSGDSMFILSEGTLDVSVDTESGSSQKVAEIIPGEYFGEMSLLTGEPRSATITAATDVYAYEIKKGHVEELFRRKPSLIEDISFKIAERRAQNEMKLDSLTRQREKSIDSFANNLLNKIRMFFS